MRRKLRLWLLSRFRNRSTRSGDLETYDAGGSRQLFASTDGSGRFGAFREIGWWKGWKILGGAYHSGFWILI